MSNLTIGAITMQQSLPVCLLAVRTNTVRNASRVQKNAVRNFFVVAMASNFLFSLYAVQF